MNPEHACCNNMCAVILLLFARRVTCTSNFFVVVEEGGKTYIVLPRAAVSPVVMGTGSVPVGVCAFFSHINYSKHSCTSDLSSVLQTIKYLTKKF